MRVIIHILALFLFRQQRQLSHTCWSCCNPATNNLSLCVPITGVSTDFIWRPDKKKKLPKKTTNEVNPTDVTFGFRRTALAELKNNTVGANGFILVTAEELVQAAEVSFGSTEIKLRAVSPGYLAMLEFYNVIHLQRTKRRLDMKKETLEKPVSNGQMLPTSTGNVRKYLLKSLGLHRKINNPCLFPHFWSRLIANSSLQNKHSFSYFVQ